MRITAWLTIAVLIAAPAAGRGAPIALDRQANHPNGAVLIVRGIELGEDSTRLDIMVTTADRGAVLNRSSSMMLIDGAGRRYLLVPPPENVDVEIPPNSRMTGEMVFSGRMVPTTDRLVLTTNDGVGGSADNRFTNTPIFRLELPLAAAAAAGEASPAAPADGAGLAVPPPAESEAPAPRRFAVDEQVNHPNGTVLNVDALESTPDGIMLSLRVATTEREVRLNQANSMQLIDERGNRYRIVPPPENPALLVPSRTRIEGRFFFAGRLQPGVQRVTLSVNDGVGGSSSNPYTSVPEFRVELPLQG